MQWHPDNFQNEEEKKKAEKKFIDIAAAKEVLTDPGMFTCGSSQNRQTKEASSCFWISSFSLFGKQVLLWMCCVCLNPSHL